MTSRIKDVAIYAVHVRLSRPDDDEPPVSVSVIVHGVVEMTDDDTADEELAERNAIAALRPFLSNSTNLAALVVEL